MSEHSTKGDASPAPHCQKDEYQFKVPKGQEDKGVFAAERIVSTIEAKTKNVNFERLIAWHSLIKFIYKSFVECLLCACLAGDSAVTAPASFTGFLLYYLQTHKPGPP